MANLSILGDKTTMLCAFIVAYMKTLMLGLGLGYFVLFSSIRIRVRVRIWGIITLICMRLLREESFFYLSLTCNSAIDDKCNQHLFTRLIQVLLEQKLMRNTF